jgi:hypothetical protein
MIGVVIASAILSGLVLAVLGVTIVCWRARVTRPDGRRHRRFHRKDIMVTAGVCLFTLAVIGLMVLKMF